jgi:putative phosphotransacetylase
MPPEIAQVYGVKDKEIVKVKTCGTRETIFGNVLVRVSDKFKLEMHVDLDEANASGLKNGDKVKILKDKE